MATGNAFVFRFENNNNIVRRYLNTAERAQVGAWQQGFMPWSLELHPGHLTGEPIYIRVDGNTDNQNVPKVDTRNHIAADYTNMNSIANYQKLRKDLTETQITVLLTFIRVNWASLSLIANRYANGVSLRQTRLNNPRQSHANFLRAQASSRMSPAAKRLAACATRSNK